MHFAPLARALQLSIVIAVAVGVSLPNPAEAAGPYAPTDLGTLGGPFSEALGVNGVGQIVGHSMTATGFDHAFVWDATGGLRDLGTYPGGLTSLANAIDDAGQIVGQADVPGEAGLRAVLWDPVFGIRNLGTLGGASFSTAEAINNLGQVVGRAATATGEIHAFLWDPLKGMRDLGTLGGDFSGAYGINDAGHVVGVSRVTGSTSLHAFVWDGKAGMRDLGFLPAPEFLFATANGVDRTGTIVGVASTAAGTVHAVRWRAGAIEDLGTLGGGTSSALALNDIGQVVGTAARTTGDVHAAIWQAGFVQDLGTLGGATSEANAINGAGLIVGGSATADGAFHAVVWKSGVNTAVGSPVVVDVGGGATVAQGVTVTFAAVTDAGATSLGTTATVASAPTGYDMQYTGLLRSRDDRDRQRADRRLHQL
jgi:probable HAF family extracellular repeat protein